MGSLTHRCLCLLLIREGDLEPLPGLKGWQDHAAEDGLGGRPVVARWHLVRLGKEAGGSQDILQVGVLRGQSARAAGGGPQAHTAKSCLLCPEVEMEVPLLLLLLLQQSMRGLSPAAPWLTEGQGQTQPRTW